MDKPFKTIDEQIALLSMRGVQTDDNTGKILEREGYYAVVNGYKDMFLDKQTSSLAGDDRFKSGTTFNDIYRLFQFDRDLKLAMSRYFHMAEATLKTVCSYQFTSFYPSSIEPYLNKKNYRSDGEYQRKVGSLIYTFNRLLGRVEDTYIDNRKSYLLHYAKTHDQVPLWVFTNCLTFGQIFKFYEYQKEPMRNAIAESFSSLYNETHETRLNIYDRKINLIYSHIKDFRNICAHDERMYCAKVSPGYDITFSLIMKDLEFVLTKTEFQDMVNVVLRIIRDVLNDLGNSFADDILHSMGISSVESALKMMQ